MCKQIDLIEKFKNSLSQFWNNPTTYQAWIDQMAIDFDDADHRLLYEPIEQCTDFMLGIINEQIEKRKQKVKQDIENIAQDIENIAQDIENIAQDIENIKNEDSEEFSKSNHNNIDHLINANYIYIMHMFEHSIRKRIHDKLSNDIGLSIDQIPDAIW